MSESSNSLKQATAQLSVIATSLLLLLKLLVGMYTDTISIISEAIHSAVDLLATLFAYYAIRKSAASPDDNHHYGHGKFENISGALEALLYPLLKGKEVMMEARFRDGVGQAFTDQPGRFEGTLDDILHVALDTNFRRAVFVATLNAIMRSLNQAEATIHCKDKEPSLCAQELPEYMQKHYGRPKIAFIGLQPACPG